MAKYIALCNWTEQGIKSVKDSPSRLDTAKALATKLGGNIDTFYMTMGTHDMVVVIDMPNDETVAKFNLMLGMAGNLRTTTLKAFGEADYRKVIAAL
jgi:uncharacterized protein with GYD domain